MAVFIPPGAGLPDHRRLRLPPVRHVLVAAEVAGAAGCNGALGCVDRILSLLVPVSSFAQKDPGIIPSSDTGLADARFSWTEYIHKDLNFRNGIWIRDTNDIFILDLEGGYINFYNGNFSIHLEDGFIPESIGGYDKNTAYLLGVTKYGDSVLRIKKWDGDTFNEIVVKNDRLKDFHSAFFYKPNEVWITTSKGRVYKFDGEGLTEYKIPFPNDTNCFIDKVYFDSTLQTVRALVLTNQNPEKGELYKRYSMFDFDGSSWNLTYNFEIGSHIRRELQFINGYPLSQEDGKINILYGTGFSEFFSGPEFLSAIIINGFSRNNLLFAEANKSGPRDGSFLYSWNGDTWSAELKYNFFSGIVIPLSENSYLVSDNRGYFAIGFRK